MTAEEKKPTEPKPEPGKDATSKIAPVAPDSATPDIGQHTQNYIEAYHATSEWIRFADAKAAVILTVGGAMGGFLVPTVQKALSGPHADAEHLVPYWQIVVVILFVLYVVFLMMSGIYAFLCINPLRHRGVHPALEHCDHFHPAAISARYQMDDLDPFYRNCEQNGVDGLLKEVQAALLLDSHISTRKYDKVKKSLKFFAASVFFGFVYFLMLQF